MEVKVYPDKNRLGKAAATEAAGRIRAALQARGEARIILATGASQFEMLSALILEPGIDWSRVTAFHLDEYLGLPITHPASFRKYLKERFADQVKNLKQFHYVNGEAADPAGECRRLGELLNAGPIDVACIGIGENAHLAFNDPPADFDTVSPYLVVELDAACRQQQLGEGWFKTLNDVPRRAISMGIRQILKAAALVVSVPDARKAKAVRDSLEGPLTPQTPGSILRQHPACTLYLDEPAASLLTKIPVQKES